MPTLDRGIVPATRRDLLSRAFAHHEAAQRAADERAVEAVEAPTAN